MSETKHSQQNIAYIRTHVDNLERMVRFHRAVENLSDQQRRCLRLRLEGLRYPDIAAVLGISSSAVGEFLRRAIAKLRKVSRE